MSKPKLSKWLLPLVLVLALVLAACGETTSVEEAVDSAIEQVEQVATEEADTINEALEEASEAIEDAEEAIEEIVEEAEEEMAAEVGYDTDVYGMIDEIDLSGTEVLFWHQHSGGRAEELDLIINDFNATNEYGITVIGSNEGGYGDIYDKMIAGLTTGDVPNLVVAYQNQAAAYQVADGLISLDPYINHPDYGLSEEARADFFSAFLNADRLPQFGGESFGFPPNRSMELLYVNTEWLNELGYDAAPQSPDEWAEMLCAAAENPFSKNPDPSFSYGLEVSTDASALAALVFARGEDVFDYSDGVFTYNTDAAVEALSLFQDLYDQGCITQIAERFGDQTDFGNGKVLFTMGSSSGLPFYRSAVDEGEAGGFEWTVAPIPYTGDSPVQNIYGASVSIPETTPEEQLAAWVFLKYYTSPEIQARWARASNYFPVRESVADGLDEYFAENPAYETAFNLLQYGKTEPPVAGYDNIRDEASAAMSAIVFDGADPAETLATLDATANQILEEAAP